MNTTRFDLAIIGGGPAGMAAALQAASAGISVAILDDGSSLGGHFYKRPSLIQPRTVQHQQGHCQP